MKKIITLIVLAFTLLMFACQPAAAQERTVTSYMGVGDTYYKYTGTSSDVLTPTTLDTIDFILYYRADAYVEKIAVKIRWDVVAGADTTVTTALHGAEFADHTTYTEIIAAAAGNAVTADNTIDVLTSDPYWTEAQMTFAADSTIAAHTVTPFDKTYRKYRLRMILTGDDSVGTGIKLDELEFKFYTK